MIIKNLFLSRNVTACALQSENVNPKESVINELKLRFKEIYVLYDNDFNSDVNRGRIAGEKLSQKFGLKQIELPELYKCKDPSDLYEALRRERTKNIISKLLQK